MNRAPPSRPGSGGGGGGHGAPHFASPNAGDRQGHAQVQPASVTPRGGHNPDPPLPHPRATTTTRQPLHSQSRSQSQSPTPSPYEHLRNVELTDCQKGDLAALWSRREEEFDGGFGDGGGDDPTTGDDHDGHGGGGGGRGMNDRTYNYICRLHAFFVAILGPCCRARASPSSREGEGGTNGDDDDDELPPPAFDSSRRTTEAADGGSAAAAMMAGNYGTTLEVLQGLLLRGGEYASVSHSQPQNLGSSSPRPPPPQQARPLLTDASVRLLEGRHVVTFDHTSFLRDLDSFELRGNGTGGRGGRGDRQPQQRTAEFDRVWSFGSYLHNRPDNALDALGCAIGLTMSTLHRRHHHHSSPSDRFQPHLSPQHHKTIGRALSTLYVTVRFLNVQPLVRMIDVRTGTAHKFLSVRGHVVRAKPKRLRVLRADFQCNRCGEQFNFRFNDGSYNVPDRCVGMKCRNVRNFTLIRSTAEYVDYQEIKLQETQDDFMGNNSNDSAGGGGGGDDPGRTPRQIEVELSGLDLVDTCNAGDVVRVSGVVKPINTALAARRTGRQALETSTYKLYVRANSIVNTTTTTVEEETRGGGRKRKRLGDAGGDRGVSHAGGAGAGATNFTAEQLETMRRIAHADHRMGSMRMRVSFPFDLLVHSVCPSIVGHDLVKAGLLLALLGGTPPDRHVDARNAAAHSIRSNSHVLVVGDPGMGKSQMLLAVNQIASRSVYVGGNTASTTGLTVSLTKESGGEVGIEAGALVLADQGVCCIDEFDKMAKTNQDGLLEAMEQQQISIAKAGVVASLPAWCSVIAAANPMQGNYNMGKTVAENLNMATPILSRFDLVFILRDRADEEQDRLVSGSIMDHYRSGGPSPHSYGGGTPRVGGVSSSSTVREERLPEEMEARLPWVATFQKEPLPGDVLRDYISYAREYCRPKMTREAANQLKEYFMRLRHGERSSDSVPITTRQLEALIRLSQARAKACLREFVVKDDAKDVIELMKQSVNQVHTDEKGNIDRTRGGAGGRSKRKLKIAFKEALKECARRNNTSEFSMDDLRRMADVANCDISGFRSMIDELRDDGSLMKQSSGTYKLVT